MTKNHTIEILNRIATGILIILIIFALMRNTPGGIENQCLDLFGEDNYIIYDNEDGKTICRFKTEWDRLYEKYNFTNVHTGPN